MMKKTMMLVWMLCLVCALVLTGCGRPTVRLNDYLIVEVTGEDGDGALTWYGLDHEAMAEKYVGRMGKAKEVAEEGGYTYFFTHADGSRYGYGSFERLDEQALAELVFFSQTPCFEEKNYVENGEYSEAVLEESLENGDVLKFVWEVDEAALEDIAELEKTFNIRVVWDDFSYEVTGLE